MPVFQPGDCVRYVGPHGLVDGVRLAWGMIGHVVKGPEPYKSPPETHEHDCYRVKFGADPAWVRADYLERE